MIRILLLPVLAVCGLVFAAWTVAQGQRPIPIAQPKRTPV